MVDSHYNAPPTLFHWEMTSYLWNVGYHETRELPSPNTHTENDRWTQRKKQELTCMCAHTHSEEQTYTHRKDKLRCRTSGIDVQPRSLYADADELQFRVHTVTFTPFMREVHRSIKQALNPAVTAWSVVIRYASLLLWFLDLAVVFLLVMTHLHVINI